MSRGTGKANLEGHGPNLQDFCQYRSKRYLEEFNVVQVARQVYFYSTFHSQRQFKVKTDFLFVSFSRQSFYVEKYSSCQVWVY